MIQDKILGFKRFCIHIVSIATIIDMASFFFREPFGLEMIGVLVVLIIYYLAFIKFN